MTGRMLAGRAVGPIGMGTAWLSLPEPMDDWAAIAFLDHAIDLGLSYVDTAMAYTTAEDSLDASRRASSLRLNDAQFAAIESDLLTARNEKG